MKPTDELKQEHQAILKVLSILEVMAGNLNAFQAVDPGQLAEVIEFIRQFADRCHHGKEEDLLFPALERAGAPRAGGPIGVMLAEHQQGRGHVGRMAQAQARLAAGEDAAGPDFAQAGEDYVGLLRQHIHKEDNVLFPLAEARLAPEVMAELERGFERVEAERMGPGRREAFHAMIDRLSALYLA